VSDSRISGLHKLSISERLDELAGRGWLTAADAALLKSGQLVLRPAAANRMVENAIGVFGLPLAIAPNFRVNDREFVIPLVVEEPSVVAAVSNAARLALPAGFAASSDWWLVAGQIHVTELDDTAAAVTNLEEHKQELLEAANAVHPRLANHGGGVRDIQHRILRVADEDALAIDILVATGDAMGANIVNTICESIAPRISEICGGNIALRILSNLADRSLVTATVEYSPDALATDQFDGEVVRDRIVTASQIAAADPYRAATHNKGIMNGVDAVAIATGNDWRAIEAGAHAYAARSGEYRPLAEWTVADNGSLRGELCMPLRVATVGGTLGTNAAARTMLQMLAVNGAEELAHVMGAVGLAQNFAAIRALATEGIQKGHMRMHARSAGSDETVLHENPDGIAAGKAILIGEHAVVYGKHAVALPIPNAVTAKVTERDSGKSAYVTRLLAVIRQELEIDGDESGIDVQSSLPPGMGLGASAAIAVAMIRAVSRSRGLDLDDAAVNQVAFECEKLAHGTPSGIDNTIATYATPMLFNKQADLAIEELTLSTPPPIVIACSSQRGVTLDQVAAVRARYDIETEHYDSIFDRIDALSLAAADALRAGDYQQLGSLMNICHGLLNAIGVSTPELESMVTIARDAGATGAKLTGSGGGGSIVALCPGAVSDVEHALSTAGFRILTISSTEKN